MSAFQNLLYTKVQDIKANKGHDNKFYTSPDSKNIRLKCPHSHSNNCTGNCFQWKDISKPFQMQSESKNYNL
jgi:hypothetical protein